MNHVGGDPDTQEDGQDTGDEPCSAEEGDDCGDFYPEAAEVAFQSNLVQHVVVLSHLSNVKVCH